MKRIFGAAAEQRIPKMLAPTRTSTLKNDIRFAITTLSTSSLQLKAAYLT
jgi:hypothetical protein